MHIVLESIGLKFKRWLAHVKDLIIGWLALYRISHLKQRGWLWSSVFLLLSLVLVLYIVGIFWSAEPPLRGVRDIATEAAANDPQRIVPGFTTTATLLHVAGTLLEKPGGYLSNDKLPPASLFGIVRLLDNIPNWEFGALVMVRDSARVLRNDFSRSQSQSLENAALAEAEPLYHFANDSWIFPATESEYRRAGKYLRKYLDALASQSDPNTQFFTRADNLNELLAVVEKRLGNLSQRLNASVADMRVNTDLAGDPAAEQSTLAPGMFIAKTPWMEIDDVFYEARGYVWALAQMLRAVEIDFKNVLQKKNAVASMQQVINLLEQALLPPASPIILNGDPLGWMANYSKGMVSFISPANAAIIDLRNLLTMG